MATKLGRPSSFTQEIADEICDRIAHSDYGINTICRSEARFPDAKTVYRWMDANDSFRQQYVRAKELQAEYMHDSIVEIADAAEDVNKARLQVDARKWVAAHLAPKKYSDRHEVVGAGGTPLVPPQADISELAKVFASLLQRKVEGE